MTTHERRPVALAASITARWPRWTPSNVPIATARSAGSSSAGDRAITTSTVSGRATPPPPVPTATSPPPRQSATGPSPSAGDGSAGRDAPSSSSSELAPREVRQRRERRQHAFLVGVLDPERPDRGAPEGRAVAAERVGDRPDVRPARDAEIERRRAAARSGGREVVDRRAPDRHLDGDAAPVQPVGALALDLHRRGGRDAKLDVAAQRLDARLGVGISVFSVTSPPRRRSSSEARAGSRSRSACRDRRGSGRAGSPARAGHEQPGRERIERARVPRLHAEAPPQRATTAKEDGPAGLSTRTRPPAGSPLHRHSLERARRASRLRSTPVQP